MYTQHKITKKFIIWNCIAIILMVGFNSFVYADDVMVPLNSEDITLTGYIGNKIEISEENRLKMVDYSELVNPFRFKNDDDFGWRGEFWGKITRAAATSYRYSQDPDLKYYLDETVNDILTTQTSDYMCQSSYISSYSPEKQFSQGWDLWGRKYVFLGLARYYYYVSSSSQVKQEVEQAMIDAADCIMEHIGPPPKKNIIDTGEHGGMASSSILEPFVILYNITEESRFLDFAQWIADQGGSTKHDIFDEASDEDGAPMPPKDIGNGKAYEMMSCFEGLAELYRITGNTHYYNSLITLYKNIRDQEIMIHGLGGLWDGMGEYWYEGKRHQTRIDKGRKGETCVTNTWFKFCSHILSLTGDSTVADQMEITMYNALIGAMRPDGEWWTHQNPTLVTGDMHNYKENAGTQYIGQDCCVASGPMALAMIPQYAVMQKTGSGPVINFYTKGRAKVDLDSCEYVDLEIFGDYPKTGSITISVTPSVSCYFTISLRIPKWSAATNTTLNVNGDSNISVTSGSYKEISRTWRSGDVINLTLDMRGRYIEPLESDPYGAIMRGPIVLSQDSRISSVGSNLTIEKDENGYINLTSVTPSEPNIWMEFIISPDSSHLCDYASAGNNFESSNTLCVWFPTTTLIGEKTIKCISDNWYARAEGGGDSNGDNIGRSSIKDNLAKWEIIADGSYYRIKLSGTDFYLSGEDPAGSIPDGRNIHLWTWANSDLQRWELIPDGSYYRLRCVEDDKYFSGSGDDSNIHFWQWVGSDLQRWDIQEIHVNTWCCWRLIGRGFRHQWFVALQRGLLEQTYLVKSR